MRTKEEINREIEQFEAECRKIRAWLKDNPNASPATIKIQRLLLKLALQDICDLVVELKPLLPYPANSKYQADNDANLNFLNQ